MTSIRQPPKFGADTGMHQLYAFLDRGRREMRNVAVVMIKKYPEGLPPKAKVLLKDDDPLAYL